MLSQSIRRLTIVGTMTLGLLGGGSALAMAAGVGSADPGSLMSAQQTSSATPSACEDDSIGDGNATPQATEANSTDGQSDDDMDASDNEDNEDNDGADASDNEENDKNDSTDGQTDDDKDSVNHESTDDETEDDCDDQGSDTGAPGELMDGQDLQSQVSIPLDEAITVAQKSADGQLGTVDLEDENGQLVYKVTIGDQEVIVDANTGVVIGTEPVD